MGMVDVVLRLQVNGRDLVGLDLSHLRLDLGVGKRLLSQRQTLSLRLGLLDKILRTLGALAATGARGRRRATLSDRRRKHGGRIARLEESRKSRGW